MGRRACKKWAEGEGGGAAGGGEGAGGCGYGGEGDEGVGGWVRGEG